jgi:hypothetical protein
MLALSAAVSALTRNQVIAFVLAAAVCFVFMMSGLEIISSCAAGRVLAVLDPHAELMADGGNPFAGTGNPIEAMAPLLEAWGVTMPEAEIVGGARAAQRVQAVAGGREAIVPYLSWLTLDVLRLPISGNRSRAAQRQHDPQDIRPVQHVRGSPLSRRRALQVGTVPMLNHLSRRSTVALLVLFVFTAAGVLAKGRGTIEPSDPGA